MAPETNKSTLQLTQLFDNLDGAVYIADMATYEVLYINPFLKQLFGDVEGALCWESLQGGRQQGPCEFCTNPRLLDPAGRPLTIPYWESTEALDGRGYSLQEQAIEWPDGRTVKLVIASDISARLKLEQALRFLAESPPRQDHSLFLRQALSQLAEYCGARWAFVTHFTDDEQQAAHTLVFYDRGHFPPPITWLLNGSPCERLEPGEVGLIGSHVRKQFPNDLLLQTLAVESHFCVPLTTQGTVKGVLVVMSDAPMTIHLHTASTLRTFARHMLTEIQCMESSEAVRSGAITTPDRTDQELSFVTSVFHNSLEAIMIIDADDHIIRVNPAFYRITGYQEQEIIGQPVSILRSDRQGPEFYRGISDSLQHQGYWQGEIWSRRKSGEVYPQQMNISVSRDTQGEEVHYIALFNDISDQKAYQAHIQHLALYDPLTDLPNRRLLQERLDQAMREAKRAQKLLALLYIDLDNFKPVNDTFGHAVGDQLLRDVTDRLQHVIRETDTLARLGGDEFALILHSLPSNLHAISRTGEVSEQIIEALATPYRVKKHQISLSASIGIALYPKDAASREDLILHADRAMYHAKKSGRSTFKFYSKQIDQQARRRLLLENRLRKALSRDEFRIHYQPQIDLESRQVSGLEALVRWQYDDDQLLYPGEFISVAEQTGQMPSLGEWVLRTACDQLSQWHQLGFEELSITINLSPKQLVQGDFPARVAAILETSDVSPSQLGFDTRELFLQEPESGAIKVVNELKQMGIRIALDDFGSGYSSLAQLQQSPLDILKMAPLFIDRIGQKTDTIPLAAAIISLAHGLKLKIVAEGVENRAQLDFLCRHRCDGAQGLMLGEPLPAEQTSNLLQSGWSPLS